LTRSQAYNAAGVEGAVTMTTGSHVMAVVGGDSVQLDCEFKATPFNLFDNPVLWRKTQNGEHTQVGQPTNQSINQSANQSVSQSVIIDADWGLKIEIREK